MLFLMLLYDFLYAKPFLGNKYKGKNKKTDTGQVRTLHEGSWFQKKTKVPSLQAGLCVIAYGSGQSSKIERLQTGLDICLYRVKLGAWGSQNTPFQSRIIVQSLTQS